jgi:hypothetical protein
MYILASVFIYLMVDVKTLYRDSILKAPMHCYMQAVSMMEDSAVITNILVFRGGSPCVLVQCIAVSIDFLFSMF